MTKNLQKIFKNLENIEPSRGLEGKILEAIAHETSQKVARRLMLARTGLAVSLGAMAYTLFVFGRAFLASDFWNLIKLVYSDTGIIAKNLSNFSVSLLETLPVIEISAMLVPVFAVMMILSYWAKFTNNNQINHLA